MGRDLYWYVLLRDVHHDTAKKLCFNYEYQLDENEVISHVYERMTGTSSKFDYKDIEGESGKSFLQRMKDFKNNVNSTTFDVMMNDSCKNYWCPKCSMFANGIFASSLVQQHIHIRHSYSSPYWTSSWNIQDFFIGTSNSQFVSLFRNENMYREVTKYHVQVAKGKLEELGEPLRTSDKEAYEETMKVIEFLDEWTEKDNVIVIMEDEY